jgi:hypothetical protein
VVSTQQIFIFPKPSLPNSIFTIQAKVTLLDLPSAYVPPFKISSLESGSSQISEPGIIRIPMEYIVSPTIGECP